MSKKIKKIASIALPIAAAYFGGPLAAGAFGTSAAVGGAIAGGVGGAAGGVLSGGGLKGALIGGVTGAAGGYLGNGGASELFGGTAVGDALGLPGQNAMYAPGTITSASLAAPTAAEMAAGGTFASAPLGAATAGAATRSLGTLGTAGAIFTGANALSTLSGMDAAKEAAKIQAGAVDKAASVQQPYNQQGLDALDQIKQIQANPGDWVQNNPFYKSLADDAQRRLMANEASKGKVGSGGTADALQTSLLNLGNGLVQQQVGTLQNQVNSGQTAASNTSNLLTDKGAAQAGGVVGSANQLQQGYQNQISTLLALQNLQKAQSYSPSASLRG